MPPNLTHGPTQLPCLYVTFPQTVEPVTAHQKETETWARNSVAQPQEGLASCLLITRLAFLPLIKTEPRTLVLEKYSIAPKSQL